MRRIIAFMSMALLALTGTASAASASDLSTAQLDQPLANELAINEIAADLDFSPTSTIDAVEVFNPHATITYDLEGATLHACSATGGAGVLLHTFGEARSIAPQEYLTGSDETTTSFDYKFSASADIQASGSIYMLNASGVLVDSVQFGSPTGTPGANCADQESTSKAPSSTQTLQRIDNADNTFEVRDHTLDSDNTP